MSRQLEDMHRRYETEVVEMAVVEACRTRGSARGPDIPSSFSVPLVEATAAILALLSQQQHTHLGDEARRS